MHRTFAARGLLHGRSIPLPTARAGWQTTYAPTELRSLTRSLSTSSIRAHSLNIHRDALRIGTLSTARTGLQTGLSAQLQPRSLAQPRRLFSSGPLKDQDSARKGQGHSDGGSGSSQQSHEETVRQVKAKTQNFFGLANILNIIFSLSVATYVVDTYLNEKVLQRNLYTAYTGLAIALDYKLNFDGQDPDAIQGLHERCADRLYRACERNQGLYIKLGQAVGANSIILPPAYFKFTKLFDDVERMPWDAVKKVVDAELKSKGLTMDGVFSEFDQNPIAAASVAQVHKARLRSSGQEVAVKVQRPSIRVQTYWDLLSFRILLKFYERIFELPLSYFGGYISNQIELETHFEAELRNAERIKRHIESDPSINQSVTVPTCFPKFSTDRLLVMDWIEGAVKMTDRAKIEDMGLNIRRVASDVCNVFAAMIFQYGFVQADGHAGNVLIRRHPNGQRGKHQVVLIDHGLYVELSDKFRREYAQLWKAIFMVDMGTLDRITRDWGLGEGTSELFASATLMRPWSAKKKQGPAGPVDDSPEARRARAQARMTKQKEVLRNFLAKVELTPKELIFVGRSMRIVQANNQTLGSPVNRINILARHAADALITTSTPSLLSAFFPSRERRGDGANLQTRLNTWLSSRIAFIRFRGALAVLDAAFFTSAFVHWVALLWYEPIYALGLRRGRGGDAASAGGAGRRAKKGFEDDLEQQMQTLARDELGVELRSEAFEG